MAIQACCPCRKLHLLQGIALDHIFSGEEIEINQEIPEI